MKEFKLEEIRPKIFLMSFDNSYDLAMHFVRYQEFYESPSPIFRGKKFELLDFMRWYSKEFGKGVFTYPDDWAGFNIPGSIIKQIWDLGISDRNNYDYEMLQIYQECAKKSQGDFYLIGAGADDEKEVDITLRHEIAHGFFYTIPEYRDTMIEFVDSLNLQVRSFLEEDLESLGYTPEVYVDEIQAYMSTGLSINYDEAESNLYHQIELAQQPFIDLYNKYY